MLLHSTALGLLTEELPYVMDFFAKIFWFAILNLFYSKPFLSRTLISCGQNSKVCRSPLKRVNFIQTIYVIASSMSHQHKGMLGRTAGQFDLLGSTSGGGNACNNQPYNIFSPL